jgi:hypothetical protein
MLQWGNKTPLPHNSSKFYSQLALQTKCPYRWPLWATPPHSSIERKMFQSVQLMFLAFFPDTVTQLGVGNASRLETLSSSNVRCSWRLFRISPAQVAKYINKWPAQSVVSFRTESLNRLSSPTLVGKVKLILRGWSPRANYTDRPTTAYRHS